MEEMPMKLIIVAIMLVATVTIGFNVLNYATKTSEETYGSQSINGLVMSAKMVTTGSVGAKQVVSVKLVGNSRLTISNEILEGSMPQGRLDVQFSNGNSAIELVDLPIDYVKADGSGLGNMSRDENNKLNLPQNEKTTLMEVFIPAGEYKFIVEHKQAEGNNWADKTTDYLELRLY